MACISVIIPIYNVEQYIRKCIDSVINQTLKDIEIILVDDGSPDNCPEICDEYAGLDSRVSVIHKANGGLSDARNAGMLRATGEYLLFVDSDDWIEAETCMLLYSEANKNNTEFVISAYYNETKTITTVKHIFGNGNDVFSSTNVKKKLARRILGLINEELRHPEQIDALSSVCSKLYKRELVVKNAIKFIDRNQIFSEAIDFNFRYAMNVNSAIYLDTPLYHYLRMNTTSGTKAYRKDFFKLWKPWIVYVKDFIEKNNYNELLDQALYNRICFAVISCGIYAVRAGSFRQSLKETREFLKDPVLIDAFNHFQLNYLPFHWKVFFCMAKFRMTFGFYVMIKLMLYIIYRKRNMD